MFDDRDLILLVEYYITFMRADTLYKNGKGQVMDVRRLGNFVMNAGDEVVFVVKEGFDTKNGFPIASGKSLHLPPNTRIIDEQGNEVII